MAVCTHATAVISLSPLCYAGGTQPLYNYSVFVQKRYFLAHCNFHSVLTGTIGSCHYIHSFLKDTMSYIFTERLKWVMQLWFTILERCLRLTSPPQKQSSGGLPCWVHPRNTSARWAESIFWSPTIRCTRVLAQLWYWSFFGRGWGF